MATGIDHIVIAVNDLEQTVQDYTAAGFTVTPGGEHTNGVTHNALVAFEDGSYFELIAWKSADATTKNAWYERLQQGEGFVDYAVRSVDLEKDVERLRQAGMDVPDPEPGGRNRPDGQRVEWQTLRFDPARYPYLPFYCHSTNDRTLRVPGGEEAVHPNGATGVGTIFIGVKDLDSASAAYQTVAGIGFEEHRHEQPEENRWHRFRIGTFDIVLVEPLDPDSDLAQSIAARGEVPIEVTLRTSVAEGSAIDHALTHGAKLALVTAP